MAQIVNVSEAKARFTALLADVESGEEIVITRAGRPIARLTKHEPWNKDRKPGAMKGLIWMSPGFDNTDEQFLQGFV